MNITLYILLFTFMLCVNNKELHVALEPHVADPCLDDFSADCDSERASSLCHSSSHHALLLNDLCDVFTDLQQSQFSLSKDVDTTVVGLGVFQGQTEVCGCQWLFFPLSGASMSTSQIHYNALPLHSLTSVKQNSVTRLLSCDCGLCISQNLQARWTLICTSKYTHRATLLGTQAQSCCHAAEQVCLIKWPWVCAVTRHCDNKWSDGSPCWRHLRWRRRVQAFSMATLLGTLCLVPCLLMTQIHQCWRHPRRFGSMLMWCHHTQAAHLWCHSTKDALLERPVTVEASECSELIVTSDLSFVFLLETSQDDALRSLWDRHGQQRRHITLCRSSCSVSC